MSNNLPPTLPAQSVVFVPDGEDKRFALTGEWYTNLAGYFVRCSEIQTVIPVQVYTRHVLDHPVHLLTPEGIEAIRELQSLARGWEYLGECNKWSGQVRSIEQSCSRVDAAFAHVIDKPAEDVKPKTCRDEMHDLFWKVNGQIKHRSDNAVENALMILADSIDAQQKVVEELLKERGEEV